MLILLVKLRLDILFKSYILALYIDNKEVIKMRNDFVHGVMISAVVTGLFLAVIFDVSNMPMHGEIKTALETCKADLPRNQECEIVITAQVVTEIE